MTRRAAWALAAVEVGLVVAVAVLGWAGFRVVLDTTAGQAVDPELDPHEPGYEAFVEPTPVALVIGLDDAGGLSWSTVLALSGADERGGAVLFVPPATLAPVAPVAGSGPVALADVWVAGGQAALAEAVGDVLSAGLSEVVVVDPRRVADLVAPAGPLAVTLGERVPPFEAGEVSLTGGDVAALLGARANGESDLARMDRHELVWRAWLGAVGASADPDVVPGERASGLGRYVRGLAAGPTTFDVIPVTAAEAEPDGADVFEPDADAAAELVAERVPFPVGVRPGSRPRVRVLDAVGVDGLAVGVARDAVRAGAQIVVVGNGDRFGAGTSRVVYFDPPLRPAAEELASSLGILEVQRLDGPNPNDVVDLTIVVGEDLAGAYGGTGG